MVGAHTTGSGGCGLISCQDRRKDGERQRVLGCWVSGVGGGQPSNAWSPRSCCWKAAAGFMPKQLRSAPFGGCTRCLRVPTLPMRPTLVTLIHCLSDCSQHPNCASMLGLALCDARTCVTRNACTVAAAAAAAAAGGHFQWRPHAKQGGCACADNSSRSSCDVAVVLAVQGCSSVLHAVEVAGNAVLKVHVGEISFHTTPSMHPSPCLLPCRWPAARQRGHAHL